MNNMSPWVSVIILNWNGWQDTVECLESLYQINYPNYQVILVDNHSQDQSIQKIREYCQGKLQTNSSKKQNKPIKITEITETETHKKNPQKNQTTSKQLTLIKNNQNHGFAQGNNIAIKYTLKKHNPQYILLLNNDTTVDSEFLREMIKTIDNDRIGIVGAKILNAADTQIIDSTGHVISWGRIVDRGHGEVDHGQYDQDTDVIGAMAAAALYKSNMLLDVGLLDNDFRILGEDADLSWRAYKRGWRAIYTPKAIVYHKRGQSITKKSVLPQMTILSTKNTTKYVLKNGEKVHKFLYLFVLLRKGLFVLGGSIIRKNQVDRKKYFRVFMNSIFKILKSIFNPPHFNQKKI